MVLDVLGVIGVVALSAALLLHKGPLCAFKITVQHEYPIQPVALAEPVKPVDFKQKPTQEESEFYDRMETGFRAINELLHGAQERTVNSDDKPR